MELSQNQLKHFKEEGFLLIRNALTDNDLDAVVQEYEKHIDQRANELLDQGKLSQLYKDQPFERRLVCICKENNEIYPELDIMHLRGKASFDFLRNKNLMKIVTSIVGTEVTCSPIQHIRAKLPVGLTPGGADAHVAPWHQDAGVTWDEADPYFILTVWIPFAEATEENGCLQIIPRGHSRGLLEHHSKVGVGTTIIDEEITSQAVLNLPMQKGSVLLMHKEISDKYDIVLIADEVITGFGRTGEYFAPTNFGIIPDITTVAKALTSGYAPLGAAIATKKISDAFI